MNQNNQNNQNNQANQSNQNNLSQPNSNKPGNNQGSNKPGNNQGSNKPGNNQGSNKPGNNQGSNKPGNNQGPNNFNKKFIKSKRQNKRYKNHKKKRRNLMIQIDEDLENYYDLKKIGSLGSIVEIEELHPHKLERTSSFKDKDIGSPYKLIKVISSSDKAKEFKDNIRKNSSMNLIEELITGINNNFYQSLSLNDDEDEQGNSNSSKQLVFSPKKLKSFSNSKQNLILGSDYDLEGVDIEEIKITPLHIIHENDNDNHNYNHNDNKENKNKSKNKSGKSDKNDKNDKLNNLFPDNNIKNISEIKDFEKKINDVSDYNLINTPFKVIGEELLNDEINTKYKNKGKNGSNGANESQFIIKKLKENFRKMVIGDVKEKPNLSKILLDPELSEDVKLKILRKYIRYSTEDEVLSESADKIRLEINNLLKVKKVRSTNDYDEIWDEIENKHMPEKLKSKLEDMYYRIISGEESKLTNFVHNVLRLPYHRVDNILDKISLAETPREMQIEFIKSIYKTLDENLFGLSEVKDSIVSYICQRINNPDIKNAKYLCLCGPAGVGKTSIVHAISEALKIPYSYISLANVDVPSTLIGHDYTYEGSTHGCIADAVMKNGCSNGIILFDELDKCKEKVHNTLLGIFDPLQNCKFRDAYFGNFHLDLSESMMIICLNDLEKINPILRDRLHIIHIPGYTFDEKKTIINKYILPKLTSQYKVDIIIETDVIDNIIKNTAHHKGVRQLIMYLTKIYELVVLDKFTCKFNFGDRFKLKDLSHIKFSDLSDKPVMSMYV